MDKGCLQKEFGQRVRRRRMALGMIQKNLAQRSGIPQPHISRVEQGKYIAMNLETLVALADALTTTVDYLLGRSNDAEEIPEYLRHKKIA